MPHSPDFKQALHTRAQLQRLNDLKIFYGKVILLDQRDCQIHLTRAEKEILVGEKFMLEIHGLTQKLIARGTVSFSVAEKVQFVLDNEIKVQSSTEKPRFTVKSMTCSVLLSNGTKATGTVSDISAKGIGVVLPHGAEIGSKVTILVTRKYEVVELSGIVKYSRPQKGGVNGVRVGCDLEPLDRLDSLVWESWLSQNWEESDAA